jgi:hypothetical protein
MWTLRVGGVQPESRTEVVGEFDSLDDLRAYVLALESPSLKILERICDDGARVQWIVKDPETRGGAGVLAHVQAVVFEATRDKDEEVVRADHVHREAH